MVESQRDICIPMFVAALFTIAKRRKQAKYPLLGEKTKNYHVDNQWNITGLAREGNCCILQHRWIIRMFC